MEDNAKMTTVIKQYSAENYYISLDCERAYNTEYYAVRVYPIIGGECRYPEKEMIYPISAQKKANAAFSRYKRKYK